MFNVMNELSELIYVADVETHELLFMNAAGRQGFGVKDVRGLKCYEVLQGKGEACEFCTNGKLQYDSFYTWNQFNPITKRHYLLKDKLIDWGGRKARIQVAFDMTEREQQRSALCNALNAEKLLMDCVELLQSQTATEALEEVLRRLGGFLDVDRAYLFRIDGNRMYNTHEWCAAWTAPKKERYQDLPLDDLGDCAIAFRQGQCISTEPRGEGKEPRRVLAPILLQHRLAGFIGLDNPDPKKSDSTGPLMKTLGSFIASSFQRQEDNRRLELLSYFDTLTGAMNRNAFTRDSEKFARAKGVPLGIVYVDVNGLKELNDRYGHPRGDKVLIEAARRIKGIFPREQLYRVGGDEFVVICTGMPNIELEKRVRALKAGLDGRDDCKAAVGFRWSDSSADLQRLVFEADERMYQDKKLFYRGQAVPRRYRHEYDDVLGLTKPGALDKLLEERRFPVFFQPKISIRDGNVIGAEALVRHRSAAGDLVPPNCFIPLLEETRLIGGLDFYVFSYVCRKIAQWLERGRPVTPVSVNFSRYSLSEPGFFERLLQVWEDSGIPKKLVEIEVTESGETDDNGDFLETINRLQSFGFSISIDDFGVKYASLPLFTTANFDVLKIDRSLILDLPENPKARAVIQSIANICREMHIRLIVEGVETREQLDVLRELGCDGAQGYLFSRPLPLEQYEARYV